MDSLIARAAVAKLLAGFPRQTLQQVNVDVYVEQLGKLDRPDVLAAAVDSLLVSDQWFPTIGRVWETYFEVWQQRKPRELEPPDFGPELSSEQIAENKERLAALLASVELRVA